MWSIVPFKILTRGKQRLAGLLTERERAALSGAMIEDLLTALVQVQSLEGILMVSDDDGAALLTQKYGLDLINEDRSLGPGLNNAVNCAIDYLVSSSVHDIMVIHGDMPLVSAADLSDLIQGHRRRGKPALTLVPDRWRKGTNCLISSSRTAIPPCFGKDSLSKHRQVAQQQGVPFRIAEIPSIMFDIDTPADLWELAVRLGTVDGNLAANTRSFVNSIDRERFRESCFVSAEELNTAPSREALR